MNANTGSSMSPGAGWHVYQGTGQAPATPLAGLPEPPPWRRFSGVGQVFRPTDDGGEGDRRIGLPRATGRKPHDREVLMVNAAIYLRRPLLVTGSPGTGKSSLAYLVSRELGLGPVLRWPVTSRTVLKDGLYLYDAIGRVQAAAERSGTTPAESDLGDYIHLGPLGTALLPFELPRVLLIDELDKGDIDLPNDLLNVFEEGEYHIPELVRFAARQPDVRVLTADRGGSAVVKDGIVRCREFPIVIITSNGEREFPPAFLRRCLKLHVRPPDFDQLGGMVAAHFGEAEGIDLARLIADFLEHSTQRGGLASDQLLNAVHLATQLATSGAHQLDGDWNDLLNAIWHPLTADLNE
ncbi:AAA family ATPase [Lentzea flava]|uniref:ATPase AAA n=1 Tax=Lentzea flava TaxID=103732 RepID=A0ABQ2URY2_9PSEU|nr:MoxR family ATPase [Lentzea flava]MCP2197193.1 AAA domain (dynein-related subfamily) [Lentzea flava]GGU50724.1 ATPase AAA [Lentzea flava]